MLRLYLQLFAEGGETAAGNGDNAPDNFAGEFEKQFGFNPGSDAPEQTAEAPKEEKPEAAEAKQQATEEQPEDKKTKFEGLIKGEYKQEFDERVHGILNDRFRKNNAEKSALEQKLAAYQDAIAAYAMKLGVDPNDVEALSAAVMEDKNNFRQRAVEKGITLEEAIQDFQKERDAAKQSAAEEAQARAVQDEQAQQQAMQQRQALYNDWKAQEAEIKLKDPSFDLRNELMTNEEFRKALDAGMSVQFAYKATHYDATMANVAGAVERQTAINTAQRIAAGRNRPAEGGLTANAGMQNKVDYNSLSDAQFMELFNQSMKR